MKHVESACVGGRRRLAGHDCLHLAAAARSNPDACFKTRVLCPDF